MNYNNITQAYQNAERQALEETNDPHLIIMTMLDALVKSMQIFVDNIDHKNGGNLEMKSKHFSCAVSIIYGLQSSLDFEKGGDIANNLFQLYEFARLKLIEDLGKGVANGTPQALEVIASISDAWKEMGKQIRDEK